MSAVRCLTGKIPLRRADAVRIAKRQRQDHEERVEAYRCRQCGQWHTGHSRAQPKRLR